MRDAVGGVVNLVIIVVFMVIVSGYMAFNVNYTKAFRVKNKIITTYEQYNGNCDNTRCIDIIYEYMEDIGYNRNIRMSAEEGFKCEQGRGYCYKLVKTENNTDNRDKGKEYEKGYYSIITQITIDLPIINKVMQGMRTFQLRGDTKTFILNP